MQCGGVGAHGGGNVGGVGGKFIYDFLPSTYGPPWTRNSKNSLILKILKNLIKTGLNRFKSVFTVFITDFCGFYRFLFSFVKNIIFKISGSAGMFSGPHRSTVEGCGGGQF